LHIKDDDIRLDLPAAERAQLELGEAVREPPRPPMVVCQVAEIVERELGRSGNGPIAAHATTETLAPGQCGLDQRGRSSQNGAEGCAEAFVQRERDRVEAADQIAD